MIFYSIPNHTVQRGLEIFLTFQSVGINPEGLSNCAVQHDIRAGDTVGGTEHTEFKLIAGKSKWRSSVAVCGITVEPWQNINPKLHPGLFGTFIRRIGFDSFKNRIQFIAEKNGHNRGRCFACTEAAIISCSRNRNSEQILIIVHRFYNSAKEQQKLCVFIGRCTRRKQILSRIGGNGPVVVFSAAVYAGKGFFVEQTHKTMFCRHFLHYFHRKLVMVGCNICSGINRCQFILSRSNFVMLRLGKYSQFPEFLIKFFHKSGNFRFDHAKIVVAHFLPFRRFCSK